MLNSYRYGFNGQEKETDINEDVTAAKFWEYDSRTAHRWNLDPKENKFPGISPYATFLDNPIKFSDPYGDVVDIQSPTDKNLTVQYRNGKLYGKDGNEYTGKDVFINQTYQAILHTVLNDKNNTFNKLAANKNILTIKQSLAIGDDHVEYSSGGKRLNNVEEINSENIKNISATIYWNPYQGLRVYTSSAVNSGRQSPSIALLHEGAHTDRAFGISAILDNVSRENALNNFKSDCQDYGDVQNYSQWVNPEEKRVVTQIETPTINSMNNASGYGNMSQWMGTRNWENPGPSSPSFLFFITNDVKSITPVQRPIPYKQE